MNWTLLCRFQSFTVCECDCSDDFNQLCQIRMTIFQSQKKKNGILDLSNFHFQPPLCIKIEGSKFGHEHSNFHSTEESVRDTIVCMPTVLTAHIVNHGFLLFSSIALWPIILICMSGILHAHMGRNFDNHKARTKIGPDNNSTQLTSNKPRKMVNVYVTDKTGIKGENGKKDKLISKYIFCLKQINPNSIIERVGYRLLV